MTVAESTVLRTSIYAAMIGAALSAVAAPALAQTGVSAANLAVAAPSADAPNPDPWEPANRRLYKLNQGLDRAVIRPGTVFYHHALTHPIREGVHNVIYNLGEPVTFASWSTPPSGWRGCST